MTEGGGRTISIGAEVPKWDVFTELGPGKTSSHAWHLKTKIRINLKCVTFFWFTSIWIKTFFTSYHWH